MPEMDGFTLAKEIRQIDKLVPILFIVLFVFFFFFVRHLVTVFI